ncbi:MAG: PmoA family protein, partial [Candidatus Marinimicrobia bacterium]|nr:PmoA family protein [Candidatus Neomarinimicrobiota bacterium]
HGLYTGLHGVSGWDYWTEGLSRNGLEKDGYIYPRPLKKPVENGNKISWEVISDWLTYHKDPVLIERQKWTYHYCDDYFYLDMIWEMEALADVKIEKCGYGGPFLRLPWRTEDCGAMMMNSEGQEGRDADQQRGKWISVSLRPDGFDTSSGVAVFDHPSNDRHPVALRADASFGIAPSSCIIDEINIPSRSVHQECYRYFIFNDKINKVLIDQHWNIYAKENVR